MSVCAVQRQVTARELATEIVREKMQACLICRGLQGPLANCPLSHLSVSVCPCGAAFVFALPWVYKQNRSCSVV